jgi:hypothetical protein
MRCRVGGRWGIYRGLPFEAVITAEARTACAIDLRFLLLAFEIRLDRLER